MNFLFHMTFHIIPRCEKEDPISLCFHMVISHYFHTVLCEKADEFFTPFSHHLHMFFTWFIPVVCIDCIDCITADECSYLAAGLLYDQNFLGSYPFYKNISYFQADFVLIKMVLYLPNFSLVFLIHVFLYAGVYCSCHCFSHCPIHNTFYLRICEITHVLVCVVVFLT